MAPDLPNDFELVDDDDAMEDHGDPTGLRKATGYMPIEHYGLIGNMRTSALVATDGGLDFMCWPNFDSDAVFCRMLDKDKGGHFTISPPSHLNLTTKQQYLPSSNVLQTRYMHEDGVLNLIDFFPRPVKASPMHFAHDGECDIHPGDAEGQTELKKWLVRRVECIRGEIDVKVRIYPAFNFAQDEHTTDIISNQDACGGEAAQVVVFKSKELSLELHATIDCGGTPEEECPKLRFKKSRKAKALGDGVSTTVSLKEGQAISFVLRDHDAEYRSHEEHITTAMVNRVENDTRTFWFNWISQSQYKGRWREVVNRSLMILKMLTFEPTGAIIAAPTLGLPELFGGARNWDYRYSWVRDSSFTVYILLRMGFSEEAEAYMHFMRQRMRLNRLEDGGLPIMFSIEGHTHLPERDLTHLDGYRGSKPVRVGNGAALHKQLDIYGELMDAIYLYNKYGKPISYDAWLNIRSITDYVCTVWREKDMSIWEVRGEQQQFVYSKIMLWVAVDRALRLSEKRSSFPCPNRQKWMETRDAICEDVMNKGYNKEMRSFVQSYEHHDMLDSAVLIAPLVFFIAPNDPRFTSTLERILRPPEKGGLTSTGLVYRYNTTTSDDGIGGDEGAFSMCTFWLVEALTRAGAYEKKYLDLAVTMFENTLGFSNHLNMFSEEISKSGEQLGNTPQAFSHLALISAAFNLDRVTLGHKGM